MRRALAMFVAVVSLPLSGAAQARATTATKGLAATSADSAAIATLEQRVEDAVVRRDAAFLDSVYAPGFRFKHSTGNLETRAERLASLRRVVTLDAPGRTIARVVDSLEVEVHGDIALTTGRIHVQRDGGELRWRNYTVRYVRIYARSGPAARWLLLTHHSTSDSQGPPPPSRDE